MNEIINKFLLPEDTIMPEMHKRQPGFTYSACRTFTKNKERIQKFKEAGDSRYIYQNKLDKACFQHGMAYEDFKDLTRRTASGKILRDKAFDIAKKTKYNRYQRGPASMVYKYFQQKTFGGINLFHTKITILFQKVLDESNHKPNKIWVNKGSEFYNRLMKS